MFDWEVGSCRYQPGSPDTQGIGFMVEDPSLLDKLKGDERLKMTVKYRPPAYLVAAMSASAMSSIVDFLLNAATSEICVAVLDHHPANMLLSL